MKCTILDRDLAEQMIADLRDQADHTLENCNSRQCIHFTLDRIADQFANALAELRRVEPVVDAAVVWRGTPPVNDSNSTATWVRNYRALESAVDAMNAGVPADGDWATERELRRLRKRVAELEALETAAARAVDALEGIGEQVKAQRDMLGSFLREVPDHGLQADKVYRDEFPELFTAEDGNALYMDEAKRRLLAKVGP